MTHALQPHLRRWMSSNWASVDPQAYDAVAGTQGLTLSRYVTPAESQRQFPTLSSAHDGGNSLKGTVRA
jgi:hypothetical protein